MKIWVQVDKPVNILGKEKFFGNPLSVCVCGGNCQIQLYISTSFQILKWNDKI